MSCGIDRACEAVRQRHVEHVVGRLAGGIAEAACLIQKRDLETSQSGLVGGQDVDASARVVLTIQREVILEDENSDLCSWEWSLLQLHINRCLSRRDGSSTHAVTASASSGCEIGSARPRGTIQRNAEWSGAAVRKADRSSGSGTKCIAGIARQNRNVVVLCRIEMDLARIDRDLLLGIGPARTVSNVAHCPHVLVKRRRARIRVENSLT